MTDILSENNLSYRNTQHEEYYNKTKQNNEIL